MPRISTTIVERLRTCPRLYYFQNVQRLERVDQDERRNVGTMFHGGLEAWWKHRGLHSAPWDDKDAALVAALGFKREGADKYEVAKTEAMLIAYHARYNDLSFEPIGEGAEVSFEVPLIDEDGRNVNGWTLVGKKDAFARFDDGRERVVEHKQTSSDITPGSLYWQRLSMNLQVSCYVGAARQLGFEVREAYYDVVQRPDVSPERATPVERREYTKGNGCKLCGGKAGEKGCGRVPEPSNEVIEHDEKGRSKKNKAKIDTKAGVLVDCSVCKGTGWEPGKAPRLYARQREDDEPVEDFKRRVSESILKDPDGHFRAAFVPRTNDELREARADVAQAAVELDRRWSATRAVTEEHARFCWPRNTNACGNQFGRPCDFLPVCGGGVDPTTSQLYRIRPRTP